VGPDQALWFGDIIGNQIVRMTTSGDFTNFYPFPTPGSYPDQIITGPDGNLWVAENLSNKVGQLNPATGVLTEWVMPTANATPSGITNAPDGALWFTEWAQPVSQIARITTAGVITEFPDGSANSSPWRIVPLPNGTIWYTEFYSNQVANIPVCAVGLKASYSAGTVTMNFSIGSTQPYTWTTGLYQNGVLFRQLWSDALPAESPLKTRTVQVSVSPAAGSITVISGLYESNGTAVCTENAAIDTDDVKSGN